MSEDPNAPEQRRDWFAVERRIFDDPMFAGHEYSPREAFLWLIAKAAKRDHHVRTRGGTIELKRGEVIVARDHLAREWGWTPKRVRTYISALVAANRLEMGQRQGQYANVAKLPNYERFQSPSPSDGPTKGPTEGQRGANEGPYPYKEHLTGDSSRGDDDAKSKPAKPKRGNGSLSAAERAEAEGAIGDYNTAASTMGFSRCSVSDARLVAVAKRLADIGAGDLDRGRVRFREALQAIPHWPFLAGREKPKPGRTPFRLDLEGLLSTGSKMGDVLAKLCDLHTEHGPANVAEARPVPKRDAVADIWREAQAEERATQRARFDGHDTGGAHGDFH